MKKTPLAASNWHQTLNQNLSADYVKMGGAEFYIADYNNQTSSLPGIPRLPAVCFVQMAGIFVTPIKF